MSHRTRREFLQNVGSGMLIAGVGSMLAEELGFGTRFAYADETVLNFGGLRPLVDRMRELPADRLQIELIDRLDQGSTSLKELTAAAALANAETFGGEDYVGFHTEMALIPAWEMAQEIPGRRGALPVLKVLYRNAQQIQNVGGAKKKTLRQVAPTGSPSSAAQLRSACRQVQLKDAERLFASLSDIPFGDQFNLLLPTIADDINVHRFVLAHRAYELADLVGADQAHTVLRQCVRYCIHDERGRVDRGGAEPEIRRQLPQLVDQYHLAGFTPGQRDPGDPWIDQTAQRIYEAEPYHACEMVAAALADGIQPDVVAQAISLAAIALTLRQGSDPWRTHGDAQGVHASDAANAWRQMIKVSSEPNLLTGLIVSAFHTAQYNGFRTEPYPRKEHRSQVSATEPQELLGVCEEAIRGNDQGIATAAMQKYSESGGDGRVAFDLLRKYAISEDGRLHAEKFYRTAVEEFATARPPFRWRYLVALARVTASAYGYDREDRKGHRAPGYEEACRRLEVPA